MKYAKMLGLLAVAAAALMAFVGTASATILTSPKDVPLEVGDTIHADSVGATTLDGTINISCNTSTVHGRITNDGGPGETVSGDIESLTFENCGNHTVKVEEAGTLEIHSIGTGTGTVTSSGAQVTVLTHSLFLGTRHCIYETDETHVGTFTESNHPHGTGSHTTATIHVDSSTIPVNNFTGDICGSTAEWTGTYVVTTPDHLYIDTE